MKVVISESQYSNLIISNEWFPNIVTTKPLKILIRESQLTKLIKEQSCGRDGCAPGDVNTSDDGWSTYNGKYSATPTYGDFRVQSYPVNIKHLCGWYNSKCYGCQPNQSWGYNLHDSHGNYTGKGKYPNEQMQKFVERIWDLGNRKVGEGENWKTDAGRVYREGINEYIELIKKGKINYTYIKKGSDLEGDKKVLFNAEQLNGYIKGLKKLQASIGYGKGSFPRMCGKGHYKTDWGMAGDFIEWVGTWDAQDWIDAAATVAFAISLVFPPAALVGVGLEAVNVGISSYKLYKGEGSWADLGLRTLFLFGGPLIGRSIGYGLKYGKKMAEKLFRWAVEALRIGGKQGTKKMAQYIISKNLTKGQKEVVEKWIKYMKNNPKKFKESMEEMSELTKKAAKGDKAAIESLENMMKKSEKISGPSLNPFSKVKDKIIKIGKNEYKINAYWEEFLNPFGKGMSAKIGVGLLSTLFVGLKGYQFHKWIEMQNLSAAQQEEIVKMVESTKKMKSLIKKMRKENLNVAADAPLVEVILEYSTKVDEEEFNKTMTQIQKEVDDSIDHFHTTYKEGVQYINNVRKQTGQLYKTFNGFCAKIPGYEDVTTLDPVTISTERSPKQRRQLNKVIKDKGVDFKNYVFVFDDKFNGIYEKEGNKWVSVLSECKIAAPLITDFCKSGDPNAKVFCNNVKLDAISLKDFNEVFINNFDIEGKQDIEEIFDF